MMHVTIIVVSLLIFGGFIFGMEVALHVAALGYRQTSISSCRVAGQTEVVLAFEIYGFESYVHRIQ